MNHLRRALAAATVSAAVLAATTGVAGAATHYANCTALNRHYPHGVGKPGAHDHTSGTPVTDFKRSKALYNANTDSDRDKDGIACEKA
jgi:uncharacterized membrane protein